MKLSVNLTDQMLDLVGSGFDLGIRVGALDDSGLVARKLATNRRVLCASPAYLQQHGHPRTPADLAAHDCLLLVGSHGRQDVWRFSDGSGGEITQRVAGRFESDLGELLRDAVVAGLGIAVHSIWHVHEELRAGRLQVVLPDYPIANTGIHAVMPQRRLVPSRVRAFVDFLAEQLGEDAALGAHDAACTHRNGAPPARVTPHRSRGLTRGLPCSGRCRPVISALASSAPTQPSTLTHLPFSRSL